MSFNDRGRRKLHMSAFLLKFRVSPPRLINCLEVVLVIALAVALADLAWQLFPLPQDSGQRGEGRKSAGAMTGERVQSGGVLSPAYRAASGRPSPAVFSLFGKAENSGFTPGFAEEEVQETELDLTLKGVLAQRDGDRKLALIARGNEKEEVYWLGDRIAGAEIIRIDSRRAILLRNGVRESLTLEVGELPRQATTGPSTGGGKSRGITKIDERRRVVTRELLDQQLDNLPGLLEQAKAVPYLNDGKQAGFRVVGIEEGSVFEDLGLRQEDIIVAVNGALVRNPREALAAYQSFKSAGAFQVDLLRGGREMTIDFSIR